MIRFSESWFRQCSEMRFSGHRCSHCPWSASPPAADQEPVGILPEPQQTPDGWSVGWQSKTAQAETLCSDSGVSPGLFLKGWLYGNHTTFRGFVIILFCFACLLFF